MKAKQVKPLPFPVYFWTVAVTAVAGLPNSIYLAISHYRVHTDVLYTSFCAVSKSLNCDAVSQSPYSIFLGIPVPVWGIFGYFFFLLLIMFSGSQGANQRRMWPLIFLTALGFSIYSIILAYISKYYIHAYCIMCIVGYAINFLLLYLAWIVRRRFPEKGFFRGLKKDVLFLWHSKKRCGYVFSPLLLSILLVFMFLPHYWTFDPPPLSTDIPTGITADGSPWIGARDPELVITEFTDYLCFHCKKKHAYLRQIVKEHPDQIRLVHKHFPMDYGFNPLVKTRFHEDSGKLSVAAVYAQTQGRFWEMNDRLYNIPKNIKKLNIKELAEDVGVDFSGLAAAPKNKKLRYKVKRDIAEGAKHGIDGTPAYVINGEVYQGRIPVKEIKKALE